DATLAITQAAIGEVRAAIPAERDIIVDLIVEAMAQDKQGDLALTGWSKLLKLDNNLSNGSVYLDLLRVQLWMRMRSVLGWQRRAVREGADRQKQANFLPQRARQSLLEAPEKLSNVAKKFTEYLGVRGKLEAGASKPARWETWATAWIEESFSCCGVAVGADGFACEVKEARGPRVLPGATAAQMKHFVKNNIKKELKVSAQMGVFTNERDQVVKYTMEAMGAEHAAELASEAVQSAPTQMILNRVAPQTKPTPRGPKSDKKKGAKAIQDGDSNDYDKSRAVETPLLRDWFARPLKKAITAAASEKIAQAMLAEGPCPRGCKLAPDVKGEETAKGAKKTTVDIIRKNAPNATECKLPYWGKVVDGSVALHLPRQRKLARGDGPGLWLYGAQFQNEPPRKKQRKSAQGVERNPLETHEIHFEPMPIEITVNGEAQLFDYTGPPLKGAPGKCKDVHGTPCHRGAVGSDGMGIQKK
ncbi:unnamed protein product, partial [Prorocentrum cordatum]